MVVFGKRCFIIGQNGCIRAKRFYSGRMVVFGQSGCIRAKVVELVQSIFIRAIVAVFGQSACNRAKVVVFG